MKENNNYKFDAKIEKLRKISGIIGAIGIFLIFTIILFDLSYPNILFSIVVTISLALVFISACIYIATWVIDVHLVYKRKQYILLVFLILSGIVFVFFQIYHNR